MSRKLNGAVTSGIFSKSVGMPETIRLTDHCSVCKLLRELLGSDSQAADNSLNSNVTKTVYSCCRYLDEIEERYDIHIV